MPDDILINLPTTVKARTEDIVIRNGDPERKKIDLYQSLRPMRDGKMGEPIKNFLRSVPVDADFLEIEIEVSPGRLIKAIEVVTWIGIWAARINAEDGAAAAAIIGAPSALSP